MAGRLRLLLPLLLLPLLLLPLLLLLHPLHFCQGIGVGHSLGATWRSLGMGEMCGGWQC